MAEGNEYAEKGVEITWEQYKSCVQTLQNMYGESFTTEEYVNKFGIQKTDEGLPGDRAATIDLSIFMETLGEDLVHKSVVEEVHGRFEQTADIAEQYAEGYARTVTQLAEVAESLDDHKENLKRLKRHLDRVR